MKKAIVGFVVGVILATASVGAAAMKFGPGRTIFVGDGIACNVVKSPYSGHNIVCVRQTGNGYGIGFSQSAVVVTLNNRKVFGRIQP